MRKAIAALAAAAVLAGLLTAALAGELEDAKAAFDAAWKGTDYKAKVAAVERMIATDDLSALKVVVEKALTADDQFVFERSLDALREKTTAEARTWLAEQATKHPSKDVRVVLARLLGTLDTKDATQAILLALRDREPNVRSAAVRATRERRDKALVRPLIDVVGREDGRVREDAIGALRDLTGTDYGREAKKWAEWWAGVEKDFRLRAPIVEGEEGSAQKTDVETVSREGLYEIRSKRSLFIIDVSSSMQASTAKGTRIEFVKKELERTLEDLAPDMSFNLVIFSDEAKLWRPRMVKATEANRAGAVRTIKGLAADGMTASFDALKLAFSLEDVDAIHFLSDGFPTRGQMTSEEAIKSEVRKWNRTRNIALNTIAFVAGELKGEREDKERAKAFMKELAAENGGVCKIVE